MQCAEVASYIPAMVDESDPVLLPEVRRHIATCTDCASDLRAHKEMSGALSVLSDALVEPPGWLMGTLTETVLEKAQRLERLRAARDQVAKPQVLVSGAILAASVAGAILIRGRRRKRVQRILEALVAES